MKKPTHIQQIDQEFHFTWVINNICTNHCDYCVPSLHNGSNHNYDIDKAKEFVERLFKRYSKIHCAISGGEPTVSPFFPDIVDMFHSRGHRIGVTSNGVKRIEYWEEISPKLNYICFSYHPSHEDNDSLLEKALVCAKNTITVIRIMFDSRHWDKTLRFFNKCKEYDTIGIEAVRVLPETGMRPVGADYTMEQDLWLLNNSKHLFIKNPTYKSNKLRVPMSKNSVIYYDDGSTSDDFNSIVTTRQTDFRGWACNIGLESLFIGWSGYVKKGNCAQGGNLFHINDHDSFELPVLGELCLQESCNCPTDIRITKSAMFDKTNEFIVQNTNKQHVFESTEDFNQYFKPYIKIKSV